jgi:hypothetical protein
LPSREVGAVGDLASQYRVPAIRQALHEVDSSRPLGGLREAFRRRGEVTETDIVLRTHGISREVLEDRRHPALPGVTGVLAQLSAVDGDGALRGFVESAQQLGERRLTSAVQTDDGEGRSPGNIQGHVGEHVDVASWVAETHATQPHAVSGRSLRSRSAPAGLIGGTLVRREFAFQVEQTLDRLGAQGQVDHCLAARAELDQRGKIQGKYASQPILPAIQRPRPEVEQPHLLRAFRCHRYIPLVLQPPKVCFFRGISEAEDHVDAVPDDGVEGPARCDRKRKPEPPLEPDHHTEGQQQPDDR